MPRTLKIYGKHFERIKKIMNQSDFSEESNESYELFIFIQTIDKKCKITGNVLCDERKVESLMHLSCFGRQS